MAYLFRYVDYTSIKKLNNLYQHLNLYFKDCYFEITEEALKEGHTKGLWIFNGDGVCKKNQMNSYGGKFPKQHELKIMRTLKNFAKDLCTSVNNRHYNNYNA